MADNRADSVTITLTQASPGVSARLTAHVINTFLNTIQAIHDPANPADDDSDNDARLILNNEGLTIVMHPCCIHAASSVRDTLQSSLLNDHALADSLEHFSADAINSLRSMIKAIADCETTCQIATPTGSFSYDTPDQMWISLNNISTENISDI